MSVERSFEPWEEVQRHGLDLADRLAQGFTGLIQSHHIAPPSFPWPNPPKSKLFDIEFPSHSFGKNDFGFAIDSLGIDGVSAILDIGSRIGQVGADFGAALNGVSAILDIGSRIGQVGADFGGTLNGAMQQFFRGLPLPFKQESGMSMIQLDANGNRQKGNVIVKTEDDLEVGLLKEHLRDTGLPENDGSSNWMVDDESTGFTLKPGRQVARPQGKINVTSTYDSRTNDVDSNLVARGDLWRVEATHGSSASGNGNLSLFLVQLGPVLFVRDTTLLLPVNLSKQHLLWYGYDRKNGVHSLCPAVWSKHRRWLLMSMLCLNPLACSFVDLQFPNGQFTYVSGEGLTTSAFLPVCGGLLQAQGQYPGEMRFSFACKNKWGTSITPMVQWPDKSFTVSLEQALAWQRSGLMVKPTVQICVSPTFGGSNPGLQAELVHSVKEQLNLICGCALTTHPSAFASVSVGRSKWNGNIGSSGIVVRVDTPLSSVGRPSISVQINSGIEF